MIKKEANEVIHKIISFILVISLTITLSGVASANGIELKDHQLIDRVEKASDVQSSISEKGFTLTEVEKIMNPYFTKDFITQFVKQEMVMENGKYYTKPTDIPLYFIPFFTFEKSMEVYKNKEKNTVTVYEYFPATTNGPVGYESHYEAVTLVKENNKWKIASVNQNYVPISP